MYDRILKPSEDQSYFLFGPRGTGKSSWVQETHPGATYVDLLNDEIYNGLLARPNSLTDLIQDGSAGHVASKGSSNSKKRTSKTHSAKTVVIIDEVQKVPALLDEVHRLIETKKYRFILTGSSARKLRRQGVNMLGGRALTYSMFPLTAAELGEDFQLKKALQFGMLPLSITSQNSKKFLESYVRSYLKEEVQQEGLTRNLGSFARFLETASFSQGALLSISQISADAQVNRKVVEDYFSILRDLLLSYELPVFSRRAKRELMTKRKFYFFDVGLFRTLRPKGPLDSESEITGPAFETLCLQELMAVNHYLDWGYQFFHWRTRTHQEVDLVLYGENGLHAIEFKSGSRLREQDFGGLELFKADYPEAQCHVVYGGTEDRSHKGIKLISAKTFFAKSQVLF